MPVTVHRHSVITARVDTTDLDAMLRRVLNESAARVLSRMESELGKVLANARQEWPVKTGRSRERLRLVSTVAPNGIEVSLVNDADYVYYIKAVDLGGRSPWRELVHKPLRRVERKLATELRADLIALMEG